VDHGNGLVCEVDRQEPLIGGRTGRVLRSINTTEKKIESRFRHRHRFHCK